MRPRNVHDADSEGRVVVARNELEDVEMRCVHRL